MNILNSSVFLAARLDWGFGNPNKTGTLIAMLMVTVWTLTWLHQRLFWLALILCTILSTCLMHTASRGSIVAATAGLTVLLVRAQRPWPHSRMLATFAAMLITIIVAMYLPIYQRLDKGLSGRDLSIIQRLELWRTAPCMMVDAPTGWGLGNAAGAFHQWYQPLNSNQTFLSLINSHLTWLVELSWFGRFAYIFTWLATLTLLWPCKCELQNKAWSIIPWTIWLVFAIAAWFSSVAESLWLWILPMIGLVYVLVARWKIRSWPQQQSWTMIMLSSSAIIGFIFLTGLLTHGQPSLHRSSSRIILGQDKNPDIYALYNTKVFGREYGRTLRTYLMCSEVRSKQKRKLSIVFFDSAEELDAKEIKEKTLVVGGALSFLELAHLRGVAKNCDEIILLNPAFYPSDLNVGLPFAAKVKVIAGEFSQTMSSAWINALKQPVQNVEGAGDFLPQWPELVLTGDPISP